MRITVVGALAIVAAVVVAVFVIRALRGRGPNGPQQNPNQQLP